MSACGFNFLDYCPESSHITTDQGTPCHQNSLCSRHTPLSQCHTHQLSTHSCCNFWSSWGLGMPLCRIQGTILTDTLRIHIWSPHTEGSLRLDTGSGGWQLSPGPTQPSESAQRAPEEAGAEGWHLEKGHYSPQKAL